MKLTGVFLIETGVVNRGDGIGNISTVKKVTTYDGVKVYFSPQSYKRALWSSLQENSGWAKPLVTKKGGVVQRTSTVIDSEEFDFAGTMVAQPKYQRDTVLYVDKGISINNFAGDMDFMTNMGLARLCGEYETSIVNRENFDGIYILPFGIELYRIGYQEISGIDIQFDQGDTMQSKIKKIYEKLDIPIEDSKLNDWASKVESITADNKKVTINLTKEEKEERITKLLRGMGELGRQIEGSERNLVPYLAVLSLDYATPKYLLFLKDKLRKKEPFSETDIQKYAERDGKSVIVATHETYTEKINTLIEQIKAKI